MKLLNLLCSFGRDEDGATDIVKIALIGAAAILGLAAFDTVLVSFTAPLDATSVVSSGPE